MGSFISRNSLAALFFLGLMVFGISNLVGSDGEEGLLMKAARDFTGEVEVGDGESDPAEQAPVATPVPAPTAAPVASVEGEFYDDAELIDSASGYNPSPDTDSRPETDSDEAMILPSPPPRPASGSAVGAEPAAGMLVGDGNIVISGSDDEDYE